MREREKANQVLSRQLMVLKHSPQMAAPSDASKARRPLSVYRPAQQTAPGKEEAAELSLALLASASEDEQRIVLALQGELERARARLSQARADVAAASTAAAAQQKRDEVRWDIEPLESIRRGIKEMTARLLILDNSHENTLSKFNAEHEQHDALVAELQSLIDQLGDHKSKTHQLQRTKQLEEMRKGDGTTDQSKEVIEVCLTPPITSSLASRRAEITWGFAAHRCGRSCRTSRRRTRG